MVLVLIASSVIVWPLTNTSHANDPMPYNQYRAFIAQAYQESRASRSQSRDECITMLTQIADKLEAVTAVRMPDGTVMSVEHCCGISHGNMPNLRQPGE